MRRIHFSLLAALILTAAGCQTNGLSRQDWFPLAQKKSPAQPEASVAELIPAAGRPERATEAPRNDVGTGHVAQARIERLVADGQAAIREQRFDAAQTAFNEVLTASPSHTAAHHGLAIVADLTENWSEAEHHYKQALRKQPRDANLLNDLGYSYLLQDRFHESQKYLSQAVEEMPQHEHAQINLAMLSLKQGRREDAMQRLNSLFPQATAQTHLARLERQLGIAEPETTLAGANRPTMLPADASFEEVMHLAAQERRTAQAERRQRDAAARAASDSSTVQAPAGRLTPSGQQAPQTHGYVNNTAVSAPEPAQQMMTSGQPGQQMVGMAPGAAAQPVMTPSHRPSESGLTISGPIASAPGATQHPVISPAAATNRSNPPANAANSIRPLGMAVNIQGGSQPMQQQPVNGQASSNSMAPQAPQYGTPMAANPSASFSLAGTAPGGGHPQPGYPQPATGSTMQAQGSANFPVAGLNAGPGALFPVSPQTQNNTTWQQGGPQPTAGTAFGNTPQYPNNGATATAQNMTMAPGTNSMLNGAMYPPVPRTVTGQQMPSMPQIPMPGAQQPNAPASGQQLPAGWTQQQGPTNHNPAAAASGGVRNDLSAPDPLSSYERQLQQSNTPYNQTLDQFARGGGPIQPVQAQY